MLPEIDARQRAAVRREGPQARRERTEFEFENASIPVTISVGVATARREPTTPPTLIKRADEKLYEAKRGGRNRVCA